MFKVFIPYCHARNIYEVSPMFFQKQGIKTLFIDLDNTLDSYKKYSPTENTKAFLNSLKENGITPVIVSNNKGKRVSSYAKGCGLDFISSTKKPFGYKIRREIKNRKLNNNEVMLVGDQLLTDVLAGKNSNIRVMLTEKLVKEDQWTTHINRLFDRPIRKYLSMKGLLKDWRTL